MRCCVTRPALLLGDSGYRDAPGKRGDLPDQPAPISAFSRFAAIYALKPDVIRYACMRVSSRRLLGLSGVHLVGVQRAVGQWICTIVRPPPLAQAAFTNSACAEINCTGLPTCLPACLEQSQQLRHCCQPTPHLFQRRTMCASDMLPRSPLLAE